MNLNTRSLGLALLLLLLFLSAALALQWWLTRETRQLQTLAVDEQRDRLVRALTVSGRPPEKWDEAFQGELGAMVGGRVELFRTGAPPAAGPRAASALTFTDEVAGAPGWQFRVSFAPPALLRVQVLHERMLAAIVLLSLLLAMVPLLIVVLQTPRSASADDVAPTPWAATRAQAVGMEHFAKISNERTVALEQEHGARVRAEEDLVVNRTLLGDSVAERVRLGRELHDNICQTLYAVCLTLESVQKKSAYPPEMRQRVDRCMAELRRLNHEVRAYLRELEPARLNGQSFAGALAGMLDSLPADGEVSIERRLDDEAVELIPSHQIAEIMNILREAVSNSLRHGRARHITVRAGRSEQAVALAVHDDGGGFAPGGPRARTGHGLDNMQARASALGGSLSIESTPGKGTRILLTLPVGTAA